MASSYADLEATIDEAWEHAAELTSKTTGPVREAVEEALNALDSGAVRVAEKVGDEWVSAPVVQKGRVAVLPPERFPRPSPMVRAMPPGSTRCRASLMAGVRRNLTPLVSVPCRARSFASRPTSPKASC